MNVGMVGCGNISPIYLKNFRELFKEVRLVAVCDLVRERAEEAQKANNVPKLYDTMEELFADPEIDIVLNLTRPYQHYGVSKAALLAGKHVYSEKPLGINFEEGKELVDIAVSKGLMIGGAPDTFLGGGIQTCRKLIEEGKIGEIVGGRFCMWGHGMETWHPDPDFFYQIGGGPLFDMGPYYVTAMINLLGGVKEVYSYAHISYPERLITSAPHRGEIIKVNTPTHIETIVTLESGKHVSLFTSFDVYNSRETRITIYGTKGTLYVPDPNYFGNEDIIFFNGETNKAETLPFEFDYLENSRLLGLADMAKSIEEGRPGRATYRQTLHVLDVMDGILRSAKEGKPFAMRTKFTKEAFMDPTKPHGIL